MKKRLTHHLLVVILSLFTLAGSTGLMLWQREGIRVYSMPDSAMAPALLRGDLLVVNSSQAPRPGDVISYVDSTNPRSAITRRVINQTEGSISVSADNPNHAGRVITTNMLLGKTVKSVPLLGYVLDGLHRPAGLAIIIYVPAFMILRAELKRLRRHFGPKPYNIGGLILVTQ